MEPKNETNRPSKYKNRKKKNFYNNLNNQVTSKIADNNNKMTNKYLRIDSCTSSLKNETLSMSNPPTVCIETRHQDIDHFSKSVSNDFVQELHSTCSDLSRAQILESNDSFKIELSSFNKELPHSSLENDNKKTILYNRNLVNFIQCEHGDYFSCRVCSKSQLLIDSHRKLWESKLNYLRKFYCAMCDKEMHSLVDWKTHSISNSHMGKMMNNTNYVSYDCGGCKAVFFENRETILKHCKTVHNDSSGLPCIFKCMKEVFHHFQTAETNNWKTWAFCGPCKKYSSIKLNCFSLNHVNKKTKNLKCNSCLIDFICNQDVFDKHLISSEHIILEYLRICKPMHTSNIKLPPVILNRFTIKKNKTTCNECKNQMMSSDKAIASHMTKCIMTPDIGGKSTIEISKYFCAVCNETVSNFSQWKLHLIIPSHLTKCYDINDLVSYTCELCSLHCYGRLNYVTEHQNIHPNNSGKNLSMFLAYNFQRINKNFKSKEFHYCEDCLTYAETNSNSNHWNKSHKTKLKRVFCNPCRTEFFCIEGNNLYNKHILSSEHIILKYVTAKKSVLEHKPLSLVVPKKTPDIIENNFPLINSSYLSWFNITEEQNKAVCITCDDKIKFNDTALLTHMLVCNQSPKNYIPKSNITDFNCLECKFHCNNYFKWRTHAFLHLDSCGFYSYFCKDCTSLLYGSMDNIESHFHRIHDQKISEIPLETVLLAKQLMRINNNAKSSDIWCFCEPCKKILNTVDDYYHFNTESHVSIVAPNIIELFYCKHCQVEFYSSNQVYEIHKLTAEHIILSSKNSITKHSLTPSKLDAYIIQFINNRLLYEEIKNIGFYCFTCDYLCFTLDIWVTHIRDKDHIKSAKAHCIAHHCTICKTLIFGKRHDIFDHYNNRFHSILRTFTNTNIQKKDLLLQTNCETKQEYKMEITENNQTSATDNNVSDITTKIMGTLTIGSNTQQDGILGSKESITNIKVTPVDLTSPPKSITQIDNHTLNEFTTHLNKTNLKANAPPNSTTTQNYSNFYAFKINMLKELLNQNKEIQPQFVFYCATCDFITTVREHWDGHNLTDHSKKNKVSEQMFCDVCNLYQFGPSNSLVKHKNTTEHLNMVDFQKLKTSNNVKTVASGKNKSKSKSISLKTKKKCDTKSNSISAEDQNQTYECTGVLTTDKTKKIIEKKNNLISDKTSIQVKQEINNDKKDENGVNNHKMSIEIKDVKLEYRVNSWVELKKMLAFYGYFRIFPKHTSAIVVFRKLSCVNRMLKDKEELEKKHEFTINVFVEEEKLPELNKSTEYEFGNKDILLKNINKLLIDINQEIINPDVFNRLFMLMSSVHQCANCSKYFGYCRTYTFGSRMSGLALRNSDVDLYFDIGGAFTGLICNDLNVQEDLVRFFGRVFRSLSRDFKQVQLITGARVPIVKFYHVPSNLNCDLSFKSGLSTHNTKLVRLYLTLDRRVHWMVCAVVKRWALQNDLKNQGMFTSYALAWLVIFYLMIIDVVPSLKLLREHASFNSDVMFIEDWDCTFCSPEKAKQLWGIPEIPCWDLLSGFFQFYANSDKLKQFVLCPALGKAIHKKEFINIPRNKREDILGFFKKQTGNVNQRCLKLETNFSGEGLAVQDPFDLFHNITKTIVPRKLQGFSYLCNNTLKIMHNGIQPYYA